MELNQVTLPVTDLRRAIRFYRALGFKQIVDSDHYARFECRKDGPSFSLHLIAEARGETGVMVYFECDDLDERVARLQSSGIEFESDPADQSWLWREAHLRDPDGNRMCLYYAGMNRLYPPWRVE